MRGFSVGACVGKQGDGIFVGTFVEGRVEGQLVSGEFEGCDSVGRADGVRVGRGTKHNVHPLHALKVHSLDNGCVLV